MNDTLKAAINKVIQEAIKKAVPAILAEAYESIEGDTLEATEPLIDPETATDQEMDEFMDYVNDQTAKSLTNLVLTFRNV